MSIDKIRNIGLDKLVTQVYDFDSLTTDELMCKFAQKINIIIEHLKYIDDRCYNSEKALELKLQYLLGQGLEEQVVKRILELVNNGTLGKFINETLLKDINDKVDDFKNEVNEELEQNMNKINEQFNTKANDNEVVKKGYANLNDFDEESRLAIAGGDFSLNYVLGKDNVKTENINQNNVTPSRTSFRKINKEKNQFDKDDLIKTGYYNNYGDWTTSTTIQSTPFIEVEVTHVKLFINIYSYICFWDSNRTFKKGVINANTSYSTSVYDIPEGTKYITASYEPNINMDYSKLFIILSKDYYETVGILNTLKNVEYYDEKLVIQDKNIEKLNLVKQSELDKILINDNSYIVLPNKIFTTNYELMSWLNSIMMYYKCDIKLTYSTGATEWGKRTYNFEGFDWSKIPNNTTVTIIFSSEGIIKYKKDIVVKKKTSNPTTKEINLMCIGDSITNRGLANSISNYLKVHYGMTTINCVGTMTNYNSKKGEGREGWKFTNFIGKSWISQNSTSITPLTSKADGSLNTNPFVRVATDSDDTSNCFEYNGVKYIFDFSNYLTTQEVTNPDVITIALSTNDILSGSETYIDDCKQALTIMLNSIRKALPNAKIGVIPTFSFAMDATGNEFHKKALKWTKSCITLIESLSDNNAFVIPSYMYVDRSTSFPATSNTITSDNTNILTATVSDNIHNNSINAHANVVAQSIVNYLD